MTQHFHWKFTALLRNTWQAFYSNHKGAISDLWQISFTTKWLHLWICKVKDMCAIESNPIQLLHKVPLNQFHCWIAQCSRRLKKTCHDQNHWVYPCCFLHRNSLNTNPQIFPNSFLRFMLVLLLNQLFWILNSSILTPLDHSFISSILYQYWCFHLLDHLDSPD